MRELWGDILETVIRRVLYDLRVALPGRVTRVNSSAGTVAVELGIRPLSHVETDAPFEVQELLDVPVAFPSSAGIELAFALEPGDPGLVVFCDHHLGNWRETGVQSGVAVRQPHALSNAIFVPGGVHPTSTAVPIPEAGVVVGVRDGEAMEVVANEVRGGRGASEPLELHSSLTSLKAVFDAWVVAPTDGGAALKTLLEGWNPQGTTVLKGK